MDWCFPASGGRGNGPPAREVREADAVVSATPQYNGGLSSVMKAAIKSLEMLRGIASHVGVVVLPQAVSIAGVQNKVSADGQVLDAATEQSVRSFATNLVRYLEEAVRPKHELASRGQAAAIAAAN